MNGTPEDTPRNVETGGDTAAAVRPKPRRFGFLFAIAVVLAVIVIGQFVGSAIERFGTRPVGASGFQAFLQGPFKEIALVGSLLSALVFVFLQRREVVRFLRSMPTAVTIVSCSAIAVAVGVLVPQIDGFEDPSERVPDVSDIAPEKVFEHARAAKADRTHLAGLRADQRTRLEAYKEHYSAFRFAEGYFVYHLLHPYGLGMPDASLPPQAIEGLEHFGKVYGSEERDNRRKSMKASFSGGTKTQEISQLIRRHEGAFHTAFRVCTALHLNRTYKSHWFATLLSLLLVAVASNTFTGKPASWLSIRRAGFFTVHIGIMVMLLGGGWSKLKTDRGILNLEIGKPPQDTYDAYFDRQKPRRMPFALSLEKFARRDWKTLQVSFNDADFKSNPPEYTLWPGRTIDFDYSPGADGVERARIRIHVKSLHERATIGVPTFHESSGVDDQQAIGALAVLAVADADGSERVLLKPDRSENAVLFDPRARFRLKASFGQDLVSVRQELAPAGDGRIGYLSMRLANSTEAMPVRVPVRVGEKLTGIGGYALEVERAIPNFRLDSRSGQEVLDPRPIAEQVPENPGVFVRITPPADDAGAAREPESRPVLERVNFETVGLQGSLKNPELILTFEWDTWAAPGPERWILAWGKDGRGTLLGPGNVESSVGAGDVLALPGDTRVEAQNFFANAHYEKNVEYLAGHIEGPEFDPDFYATAPTGANLEITLEPETAGARAFDVRLASSQASLANYWPSPDGRFFVHYFGNDRVQPFEWRSVLKLHTRDESGAWRELDAGDARAREIRVNDYFYYRGYRFFQTNADARFPNYSGVGVVYDPGIPVVLFGMYVIILGTVIAFLVRPIVLGYGKWHKNAPTSVDGRGPTP